MSDASDLKAELLVLKAENAELREELDLCLKLAPECDGCEAMLDCYECLRADSSQKERKRLGYENEKLRELAKEACELARAFYDCGGTFNDLDDLLCEASELGIEVDA